MFEIFVRIHSLIFYINALLQIWFSLLFPIFSVAHFLESRKMFEDALEIATDPDYRFDLAIQLGRLEIAKVI